MRVLFRYDGAVLERFPTTRGGVLHATGLVNGPAPADLAAEYRREQARVRALLGDTRPAEVSALAAWRRTFAAFGVKPTQYRSAAEALLRRLTKKGDIPALNLLVDLANLVSIHHALPVAVFDLAATTGAITVRFATGGEKFTDLATGEEAPPSPGEVVFVDEAGLVSARRWCWRQSLESAAGAGTTTALMTVEGQHDDAATDVAAALGMLKQLVARHCPEAAIVTARLGPGRPAFATPR